MRPGLSGLASELLSPSCSRSHMSGQVCSLQEVEHFGTAMPCSGACCSSHSSNSSIRAPEGGDECFSCHVRVFEFELSLRRLEIQKQLVSSHPMLFLRQPFSQIRVKRESSSYQVDLYYIDSDSDELPFHRAFAVYVQDGGSQPHMVLTAGASNNDLPALKLVYHRR